MNFKYTLLTLLVSFSLSSAPSTFAQPAGEHAKSATADAGKLIAVSEKEAAWAAEARKSYPLDVCVVSDEKLGSMGKSPEYVYRVAGKPDRLVVFCCSGCDGDFLKDPAAHLAKLDAAAAKRK